MIKYIVLFLLTCMFNCTNPAYVMCPVRFHFQTDLPGLGLGNLNIVLHGDHLGTIDLDSIDFFKCPTNNDTCDRRGSYFTVPNYTVNVPMTKVYGFSMADNKVDIEIVLKDSSDTLLKNYYIFEPPSKLSQNYLIYLGYSFDENNNKLKDFISAVKSDTRHTPGHTSFPISGSATKTDSLYLIWVD